MPDQIERHGELINKLMMGGLTEAEAAELTEISRRLDDAEAERFRPIVKRLMSQIEQMARMK